MGGKQGCGGFRPAADLNVFVLPRDAAILCSEITLPFPDCGPRGARNKSRPAFLAEEWGADRLRSELETRVGHPLLTAGLAACREAKTDHIAFISRRKWALATWAWWCR